MDLSGLFQALILLGASFVHGLAGFAFALFAVPLLSLWHPLPQLIPVVALWGFTVNLILFWVLRRSFRLQSIGGLLLGAVPGVFLGSAALGLFPEKLLRSILSFTLGGYSLWNLKGPSERLRVSPRWGVLFGLLAGFLGGMLNTPGPPVVVYVTLLKGPKDQIKSALQGGLLFLAALMALSHGLYGRFTWETFKFYFFYLPVILLGLFGGQKVYGRLGDRSYYRLLNFFLLLSALAAIIRLF